MVGTIFFNGLIFVSVIKDRTIIATKHNECVFRKAFLCQCFC